MSGGSRGGIRNGPLPGGELLFCSHRGPISFQGGEQRRAGPGGLVSVLAPAIEELGATWIYAPSSDEDRALARAGAVVEVGDWTLAMLDLPPEAHRHHYATVSTEVLSSLFHCSFALPLEPAFGDDFRAAWESYRHINGIYAKAIADNAERYETVLVDDMHLLLAAATARDMGVRAPLSYFHHVPWCEPGYFAILPEDIRAEILASALDYNCVGFHCERWASAFGACCERFLPGAKVTDTGVAWRGRFTRLLVAPAALEGERVAASARSPASRAWQAEFEQRCAGRSTVVRVERGDPAKNGLRGIQAFELLLERRPELAETTCMLFVATVVRPWIRLYCDYVEALQVAAARVNERFPGNPIELDLVADAHADDQPRALAALAIADIAFVGSTYDGLNLVAIEAAIVGDAALVLSQNTGVYDVVGDLAWSFNPFDLTQAADQLARALDQPVPERVRDARARRQLVRSKSPRDWVKARSDAAQDNALARTPAG